MAKFRTALRTELDPDGYDNTEFITSDLVFKHLILGDCHGIGFHARSHENNDVMVVLLTEDDGQWFASTDTTSGFDSAWMPEYVELMKEGLKWLEENCDRPGRYGWKFRTGT